jgi:hypothetical protein
MNCLFPFPFLLAFGSQVFPKTVTPEKILFPENSEGALRRWGLSVKGCTAAPLLEFNLYTKTFASTRFTRMKTRLDGT